MMKENGFVLRGENVYTWNGACDWILVNPAAAATCLTLCGSFAIAGFKVGKRGKGRSVGHFARAPRRLLGSFHK